MFVNFTGRYCDNWPLLFQKRLIESTKRQFNCANPSKSERAVERMRQIMEEENEKLLFEKHKANPPPSHMSKAIPIKLNTAAILREGNLYKQKEKKTLQQ